MRDPFAAGLNDLLSQWARGKLTPAQAARRLRKALAYLEAMERPPEAEQAKLELDGEPEVDRVVLVFEHWRKVTKRPRSFLTPGYRETIGARLEHFTVEELNRISSWAAKNDFHQGRNDKNNRYDTIETLFRNDARVISELERCGEQAAPVDAEVADIEARAMAAGDRGDWAEYEKLNGQLADRLARL